MIEKTKINATHLTRNSVIYIRQSTMAQIEKNRESTDRQYQLIERAQELGWRQDQIIVIDEDLGCTGSGAVQRSGFEKMASEVALGRVGIILGLEVSRLARNNSDWYRLIELAGITDTLIADADGVYHPGVFNDRLLLGLKGTMSEAELYLIRARMNGGRRNKAARGELRCSLPVGYIWSDDDEVKLNPNEAIMNTIRNVFERFAELGSARQVWLWFRSQGLPFPIQRRNGEIRWVPAAYWQIQEILTNPAYAGVYAYGKTRSQRCVDTTGRIRSSVRNLPQEEWLVLIHDHHEGFIDWQTYQNNRARLLSNFTARPHDGGGAVREGSALLQGLARCGRCGRRFHVKYGGKSTPGYYCPGSKIDDGKVTSCVIVWARQIDEAVVKEFLKEMNPAGVEAAIIAEASLEGGNDAALDQWRLEVERLRYEAEKAERRYRAVEPENRLVARGLEADWEKCLRTHSAAVAELATREKQCPRELTVDEKKGLSELADDIGKVWSAPTTTDRDRKELLRTVLEEVNIGLEREARKVRLILRWRGGAITELDLELKRLPASGIRTDEDTIELLRRLAQHYPDDVIAGILNRQGRRTATGEHFNTDRVRSLRVHRKISKFEPQSGTEDCELVTVEKAAEILGIGVSTLHHYLSDGFVAGVQLTRGAPWRIRITDELLARFTAQEPEGYVSMQKAMKVLGVSRQTIMQRIKRGELHAICSKRTQRKELRIKIPSNDGEQYGQLKLL